MTWNVEVDDEFATILDDARRDLHFLNLSTLGKLEGGETLSLARRALAGIANDLDTLSEWVREAKPVKGSDGSPRA